VRILKPKSNGARIRKKVGLNFPRFKEGFDGRPCFISIPEVLSGLDPQLPAINSTVTQSVLKCEGFRIDVFRASLAGH